MTKKEILDEIVDPEIEEILDDVSRVAKEQGLDIREISDLKKQFPVHYWYYHGIIEGLWLSHIIRDREEWWDYLEFNVGRFIVKEIRKVG